MQVAWLIVFVSVLGWSAVEPHDYFTWGLEVSPALIGLALLAWTRQRFPLTPLLYGLILVHCVVLMVGGHYTYAKVPLFDELSDWFGWQRNNYDKLGHFLQGLTPALLAREILLRQQVLAKVTGWLSLFVLSVCLAFSALYELLEWLVASLTGASAEAFLGTQGYQWDTQTDMAMALLGGVVALLGFSRLQDRQLSALQAPSRGGVNADGGHHPHARSGR